MRKVTDIAKELFIFKGITEDKLSSILECTAVEVCEYSRGETIYSQDEFEAKIGFVLEGKCAVKRPKSDGSSVVLNILEKYDSFGITAAFSEEEHFPTEISAMRGCELLFIRRNDVIELVKNNSTVAMNVIEFLVNRISFLNKKITTFTHSRAENKLANHILNEYYKNSSVKISFNCKKAAEALNIGRASVYRSLETLCRDGIISYDSKKIYINDLEGLERISK